MSLEAGRVQGTLEGLDQTKREDDVGLTEHTCGGNDKSAGRSAAELTWELNSR